MDLEEERLAEKKTIERTQQENRQRHKEKQKAEEEAALHQQLKDMKDVTGAGNIFVLSFKKRTYLHIGVTFRI